MKQSRKEFIKRAHSAACNDWKKLIEAEFPELFKPEIEVGKWYKYESAPKSLLFITNADVNSDGYFSFNATGYGFNYEGEWDSQAVLSGSKPKGMYPATPKEVETALIAEAKRRGFKEGVKVQEPYGFSKEIARGYLKTNKDLSQLYFSNSNYCVFNEGKWASIIEEEKPIENPINIIFNKTLSDAEKDSVADAISKLAKGVLKDTNASITINISTK